jgi:hypothetical protein
MSTMIFFGFLRFFSKASCMLTHCMVAGSGREPMAVKAKVNTKINPPVRKIAQL